VTAPISSLRAQAGYSSFECREAGFFEAHSPGQVSPEMVPMANGLRPNGLANGLHGSPSMPAFGSKFGGTSPASFHGSPEGLRIQVPNGNGYGDVAVEDLDGLLASMRNA
jgi:hypothetical protein